MGSTETFGPIDNAAFWTLARWISKIWGLKSEQCVSCSVRLAKSNINNKCAMACVRNATLLTHKSEKKQWVLKSSSLSYAFTLFSFDCGPFFFLKKPTKLKITCLESFLLLLLLQPQEEKYLSGGSKLDLIFTWQKLPHSKRTMTFRQKW